VVVLDGNCYSCFNNYINIISILINAKPQAPSDTTNATNTAGATNTIIATQSPESTIKPVVTPTVAQTPVVTVKPTVTKEPAKPVVVQAPVATVKSTAKPNGGNGIVVYRTDSGTKYHMDGCSSLAKSKIAVSLANAKAMGLTPCSKCHPPE
jgi:hypothetical protein